MTFEELKKNLDDQGNSFKKRSAEILETLHKSLFEQKQAFKKKIDALIKNLPDNKDRNNLSENCFTISFSQLNKDLNLSPKYYNFKQQYKEISERINKSTFSNIPNLIRTICSEQQYHIEVRDNIKKMWGVS